MTSSRQPMRLYFKENLPYYLFIFVLFATGIVFGAVMVNALTLEQKQELSRHLSGFIVTIDQGGGFDPTVSFQQSLMLHLKWIALIWALGLSIIGLPLVFALDFLKGVLVGFSAGYMISEYSWQGMVFALASVLPQNLIIIPAMVVASVAATVFAVQLLKTRMIGKPGQLLQPFWSYTGIAVLMAVLLAVAALYEGYLSPGLMKWVTPMLLSAALLA
ncbi:MAG: spoIIM [Paenibacillaceae bacterium]|nr:spoIIM [Paenibacillaceae bacterium]